MAKRTTLTAEQLMDRLRVKFGNPEKGWAMLEQVASCSGFNNGYSDAVAIQLWPSRGHQILGFELKVSRGDWLRELKNRKKTEESAFVFCHQWWVVADRGCVQDGELPATWGLLGPSGQGLAIIKQAPELTPQEIDLSFLAAVLRRAAKASDFDKEAKRYCGYKDGFADGKERAADALKRAEERADRLKTAITEFERASGVRIGGYQGADIGAAVKAVLQGSGRRTLELLRRQLNDQVKTLDQTLAEMTAD
jgi:hypothetical protein